MKGVRMSKASFSITSIEEKIFIIRGQKVMLDKDLAELYGVTTKRLKQQVNRNKRRFPKDFMFELTWDEAQLLIPRLQFATLESGGNVKYLPYVFTEQGVAMLSSVLNSPRAIDVNIQIMRVFVRLKEMIISHKDLAQKIDNLEKKFKSHDEKFILVFEAIRKLMREEEKPKRGIGFHVKYD